MIRVIEKLAAVAAPLALLYGVGPAQVEALLGVALRWLDRPLVG